MILLLNLEPYGFRIPIAPLDVIHRHREAPALGMPRCHRSEQVGRKRGNPAFARQVVAEKRDGLNAGCRLSQASDYAALTQKLADIRLLLTVPIGGLLALDTARRPWHGREAFWADRRVAINANSKAAVVNPSQCGFHLAQQGGIAVHVSNRQISFRRILNLIHLIRALLDGDVRPAVRNTRVSSACFRSRIS